MLAVKSANIRDNFKEWCDKISMGETVVISRPRNENIYMINEAEYNELQKAKKNAEYLAMLERADEQVKNGQVVVKTMEELIAMEDVKDDTFANKVLGDGVAVIPAEGKVYAPADGMLTSVFDTKHAICFASSYGTELLIHIGVDTVNLQGKYFTAHVKDGDTVKRGQLLVEFDKEQVEKAGYDMVIPMIFTDLPEEKTLEKTKPCKLSTAVKAAVVHKV